MQLLRKGLNLDYIVPHIPETVPYLREERNENSGALHAFVAHDAKIVHIVVVTSTEGVSFNGKRIWKEYSGGKKGSRRGEQWRVLDEERIITRL
ncbi:hypothetical protein FGB62_37g417 [Gracilaria domingensis]|nr:hypothetical protein FGB62_37g417 [Gracilaria domingensis]